MEYIESSQNITIKMGIKVRRINACLWRYRFIKDTGVGMTNEEQVGLFQRFSQVS